MLAQAYGLDYQLPQQAPTAQIRPATGTSSDGDTYGIGNLLEADLYVREGVTDEYYKQVAALKSFANEISSRYGYDVTRPNYKDPESIKFHKTYLEGLASLQAKQNELKRLATHENMSLVNPDMVMRRDESGRDFAVNVGKNSVVKSLEETASRIESPEDIATFNDVLKPQIIEQLQAELSESEDPREREELKNSIRMIQSIMPKSGMSEFQSAQVASDMARNREYARHNRAMEEKAGSPLTQNDIKVLGRFKVMDNVTLDPQTLSSNLKLERMETASGTYFRRKGEEDSNKWIKANPDDPAAFIMSLNELMNRDGSTDGANISIDQLYGLEGKMDYSVLDLAKTFLGRVEAKPSIMENFSNQLPTMIEEGIKGKRQGKGDNVTPKIVNMLQEGKRVPDEIADKYGSSLEDKKIISITHDYGGFFGSGAPRIVIKVPGKTKGTTKPISLSLDNQEDVEVLRQILNFNGDRIPRQLIESMSGAVRPQVQSTPTGSLEDILP